MPVINSGTFFDENTVNVSYLKSDTTIFGSIGTVNKNGNFFL
jgi:hypothetical protein